ncbi:hypothetical protein SAMD00019534_093730 [Acytostelium subglobosum LB1]|uniref:hypothetical protein n=1 Tax=Acytostelium subglobosum LB1 TaxID=1410327 RepID=UPI0006449BA6|nr:hypothetical protein SAMD00019534_093730 [Acytostelium subglobosum LB1]GAM26198.1 hypothetical protein SAMD00019534_093730 [Acytostelium subglobosum LB1]|eukprot:XP_012750752.1 hypothetical protein SAMD00019534_093730 [Acytostelium subglobosum LB1]
MEIPPSHSTEVLPCSTPSLTNAGGENRVLQANPTYANVSVGTGTLAINSATFTCNYIDVPKGFFVYLNLKHNTEVNTKGLIVAGQLYIKGDITVNGDIQVTTSGQMYVNVGETLTINGNLELNGLSVVSVRPSAAYVSTPAIRTITASLSGSLNYGPESGMSYDGQTYTFQAAKSAFVGSFTSFQPTNAPSGGMIDVAANTIALTKSS